MVVEKMLADGDLVLLPMSDIRGYDTTGMNAAVYISEAQNMDIELMRLALQRIGDDCICIIDGDDDTQLDLSAYAGSNSFIVKKVSKFYKNKDKSIIISKWYYNKRRKKEKESHRRTSDTY